MSPHFFLWRTACPRAASLARWLTRRLRERVAGWPAGEEPCSAAAALIPVAPGVDEPGIPRGGLGRLPRRGHGDLRAGRSVQRRALARGDAVRRMAGRGPRRSPALRRRRLSRVPRRRPGQQARPADGGQRARRLARPQAGQAERRRTRRAAGRARTRAHHGVRRVGAVLRAAVAAVLGPDPPQLPGHRRHRGRDGGRGLRRMASARLGPGQVAGQGLPPGRPRARAGRVAWRHAAALAGAHRVGR